MELALATNVAERVRSCAELLSMSVSVVELYNDDTEITAYKLLVAKAVGEMGFALLFPIYQHYPQLKPGPEARPNPVGGEILTVDVNKDPSKLAEIVMNVRERVRAELVSLLKMVQEG